MFSRIFKALILMFLNILLRTLRSIITDFFKEYFVHILFSRTLRATVLFFFNFFVKDHESYNERFLNLFKSTTFRTITMNY